MYNTPPSTHTQTQSFLSNTMLTTSMKHTSTHTRTAYYLYEVLYTNDHQHRVSLFSNPHSSLKDCSMQWRDYTVGLIGVLIWVIVRALDNKNWCRNEYHWFYMILLNVLQLCNSAAAFTAMTHALSMCVSVLLVWLKMSVWRFYKTVKPTINIKTTTVQLHYLVSLLPLQLLFLLL